MISFETCPAEYRHWKLKIGGASATLAMDVDEDETLEEGYKGRRYVAALNGSASGGGYELALACDEIYLADDGEGKDHYWGNALDNGSTANHYSRASKSRRQYLKPAVMC